MERERITAAVDETLVARLAELSRGSQRWLKTALQTIVTSDLELADEEREVRLQRPTLPAGETPALKREPRTEEAASLEDVITGKADLREHLDSYPELQQELEGLADVIDLLREAGESRRKRGEQILREEILGEEPEEPGEDAGPDEGQRRPRRR